MIKNKKALFIATAMVTSLLLPALASASQLSQAGVRLGRLGISATTNNDALVTFKLNTTPTSVAKIIVTFPSGFNLTGSTTTPITGSYPNTPATIVAPPGTLTGAIVSNGANLGGTITISGLTSASLTNTALYGVDIPTGVIANPPTAGQYMMTVASANSSGTPIDTTYAPTYMYGTVANQDQVSVNASVAPTFTFALSANTDTVPKVDPTTIQTSPGVNMTVSTNSPLGYTAYVKSANDALVSATNPGTPITTGTFNAAGPANALTAGSTNYTFVPSTGAACTSCTGSLTYDPEYTIADASHGGAFPAASAFASFVSRNGYTNADTVSLKERVTVSNTVGYANDYADTLTIVAAGNY
jgi:hypothetical protein